mgnify:CR=1 FL=1
MPHYEYDKDYPFAAFITNLGKYNEGSLVGEWVKFPTTAEELQKVFERIGIGSKDDFGQSYEEWFITDYDCYVDGLYDKLGEYENLDELNYLASKLDEMSQGEYEQFQAAMEIGDHSGSLQEIINLTENLLTATRIENGGVQMEPELLEDVLKTAVRQVDRRARDHHISVTMKDPMLMARMNAGLILRVIINIVNNAIQYTPAGSQIALSAERKGDMVEVSISDDGPGIPDEAKKHLFDLFYTAGQGRADCQRGLGLGLNLCQTIITQHGGELKVADHKPRGTVFRFTLPAAGER